MEEKQMNKYGIVLDGRMDEPVWDTVQEYKDFWLPQSSGGQLAQDQTSFKILPCEDRIYIGVKCMESDMQQVISSHGVRSIWGTDRVELMFSPTGRSLDFYQFVLTFGEMKKSFYYIEGGNTQPSPYIPDWDGVVYAGEDYWSAEIEIPMSSLYMTPNTSLSDTWAWNIVRCHTIAKSPYPIHSASCPCERGFREMEKFQLIGGFPSRPDEDEVCISKAVITVKGQCEAGYDGTMTVFVSNLVEDVFEFTSDHGETKEVTLHAGTNTFEAPCFFEEQSRYKISLQLKRLKDGKIFKIYYPVTVTFEPIKLRFALPEYRCNFYPGQDYSQIVGVVTADKPVTLTLEGPGIETTVTAPNADGSFRFETPNFQEGEAFLTATIDDYEIKQKIRRLAPSKHTMAWISGGNLVVNGKPVLRRNLFSPYYRGGEAFRRKYDADNLHETREIVMQSRQVQPCELVRGSEAPGGEATKDAMPSEEMFRKLDELIEHNKERDFVFYYPSDEPECRGLSPIYMKHYNDYIADKDPYHVLLSSSRSPDTMVECFDWMEVHPYINPHNRPDGTRYYSRPISAMGAYVDKISKLNRPDKCVGFLPTAFASPGPSGSDYPTLDETICHTWAAMIHGGKSLAPYAYHDANDRPSIYEGTRYTFSSFEALEEIVLFGKRTTLFQSNDAEAVLYEHGNEKMFVLVNFTQEPQTVTLEGISGTWHEFRHNRTITDNTFNMKPLEVIIGTNTVKDAGLPTYQETAQLIDKLEYERTHRGSLLFDRFMDISITSSGVSGFVRSKLFDGTLDNLAGWVLENPDNFVELNLTKVNPTFHKVEVRGWHLEDMQIKVRIGDELITPEAVDVQTEEFSKSFLLKETVTPDALRLEFGGVRAELYEIAVF